MTTTDDTVNNLDHNKCVDLIKIMNQYNNKEKMQECYYKFCLIKEKFPPQKNENKFIYGKLGEMALNEMLINIGINVKDLDENHVIGSEYKNYIEIDDIKFSIKVKLNKNGNVIMINCKSTTNHIMDINTIVVVINEKKIYIIPKSFNTDIYIKRDSGSISFKSSLFTFINKNNKEFIYTFPELNLNQIEKINNSKKIEVMKNLYETHIK